MAAPTWLRGWYHRHTCDTLQVALDLTHGLRRWMWQTKAGDNGSGWPRLNKNGAVIQGVTNGWQTGRCSGRFAAAGQRIR